MMREVMILFRGRLKGDDDWVFGFPAFAAHYPYDGTTGGAYIWKIPCADTIVAVDYETVGQFTGFKDKHGNKIFEGDIIQWDFERVPCLVYWSDRTCQFTTDVRWLWSSIEHVEILGNIHDNPELLQDICPDCQSG